MGNRPLQAVLPMVPWHCLPSVSQAAKL